jgi:hypothetical protein
VRASWASLSRPTTPRSTTLSKRPLTMAGHSWFPFHLSKDVGKDILGGVKQVLTLSQGPLGLVGIPALPTAIGAVLGIVTAFEVSASIHVESLPS